MPVHPAIYILKFNPQCDDIYRGGLGEVIRTKEWDSHE
jgi:hypothetical protein